MNEQTALIDLELIGYWIRVWQTPDGYLVSWGDYVANTWLQGCETLAQVLELFLNIENTNNDN